MPEKVFVTSKMTATFSCPKCGDTKRKDVSRFIGHETQVRLKCKCKCRHDFSIILERRRSIRKGVNLKGYLIIKSEKYPILVEDLSKHGIRIKIQKQPALKLGQRIEVEFTLDDPNESKISRDIRIKKFISPISMGCEFLSFEHHDNLGKYFLFSFEPPGR